MRLVQTVSRRRFQKSLVCGAAALLPGRAVAAIPPCKSGLIDAHVHVWHPDTQTYPISKDFTKADMQPPSFTAAELFEHCKPEGVDRVVLIQMSFYEDDHSYMIRAMKDHPGVFSGVALIDYRRDDVAQRVDELASQGMRGFRLYSNEIVSGVDTPGMWKLWQKAADEGLAICPLINPPDIPHVETLCKRFPNTTVVIDHFARIGLSGTIESAPLKQLCRLARYANTYVKTSAFYALGRRSPPYSDLIPMIRQVVDAYGPERLMWASDCPFQVQGEHDYKSSISLIRDRIDFLSEDDKRWLLGKTAERVFFDH